VNVYLKKRFLHINGGTNFIGNVLNLFLYEPLAKCLIFFKFKECKKFNHKNTCSMSTACQVKFLPDTEIGKKGAFKGLILKLFKPRS
jgi:hypothetical protein